jgi:hypothetical protein
LRSVQQVAVPFIAAASCVPTPISAWLIVYDPHDCPTETVILSISLACEDGFQARARLRMSSARFEIDRLAKTNVKNALVLR